MTARFLIAGPPRTKKTSLRVVTIPGRNGARGFTKILPSEAFEEWLQCALLQGGQIRYELQRLGYKLPIASPVSISAQFFRQADTGDTTGFYQSLADALHAPQYRFKCTCGAPGQNSYTLQPINCRSCTRLILHGKESRKGLGIIRDDSQISHWDGSRLFVDRHRPRVEVTLTVLAEAVQQETLAFAGAEQW